MSHRLLCPGLASPDAIHLMERLPNPVNHGPQSSLHQSTSGRGNAVHLEQAAIRTYLRGTYHMHSDIQTTGKAIDTLISFQMQTYSRCFQIPSHALSSIMSRILDDRSPSHGDSDFTANEKGIGSCPLYEIGAQEHVGEVKCVLILTRFTHDQTRSRQAHSPSLEPR